MSDEPKKPTTGADIIAAIKWAVEDNRRMHKDLLAAIAELKSAKPAQAASGKNFDDPVEMRTYRGFVVVKDGVKISEKQARVKLDINGKYLAMINRGHRREEIRNLGLCEGDEVEFTAEIAQEKEWEMEGRKGKNWEAIAHGCKVIKRAERPLHQDSYADFGAPRDPANYSATGYAVPGTTADDTDIPFSPAIYP